jgi:hypothetical protein
MPGIFLKARKLEQGIILESWLEKAKEKTSKN